MSSPYYTPGPAMDLCNIVAVPHFDVDVHIVAGKEVSVTATLDYVQLGGLAFGRKQCTYIWGEQSIRETERLAAIGFDTTQAVADWAHDNEGDVA